ncbi:MAG: RagB/SusD family nutrient uptake outer membrane protein [Salinimicrobium sediminis]|nr:RagB/SusD family nutrient uptake outer membrane protein [Salinimicrobium sediminis]
MKYLKRLILMFLLIQAVACSKDVLDKDPVSSFSAQDFYKTSADARAGVNGIYDALQSTFSRNFAFWGEGRADAVDTRHSGDPLALKQNNLTPTINSASWNNLYEMISRANYAIKYIPGVFEEENDYSRQLIGQARALRALAYFYGVKIWGDVPLILEPYESIKQDVFVNRTDEEAVLDQVINDLRYAAENAQNADNGGESLFMTQEAAQALLVHVYMWREDYPAAIEAAEKVINSGIYSLEDISNWNKIFTTGSSNETIFEIGYNETQTNFLRVLYALGSDSHYFPSEKFRNSFEEGDARQHLIYDETEENPRKIWKFFGAGFNDEDPSPSENNIVLLRLADIMLLKAEAHNALGETEKALDLLNTIRERAELPGLTEQEAIEGYGDIESAILHERFIELSFEGHRWFDLVRTGRAIEVMNPINGLSDELNLVWPIHEDALNRNPNLDQNLFYR